MSTINVSASLAIRINVSACWARNPLWAIKSAGASRKSRHLARPRGNGAISLEASRISEPQCANRVYHIHMALTGYARCSTTKQDTQAQLDALKAAGVGVDRTFSEYISGAAPFAERIALQQALATLEPGDELVIAKLDRLGRTMQECVARVAELLDNGAHVRTLDGRVNTAPLGKMAKLVVGILAAAAELERELILERTNEGRARAQAAGVKFGRKRTWRPEQAGLIKRLNAEGISSREIGKQVGLSGTTVRRILNQAD